MGSQFHPRLEHVVGVHPHTPPLQKVFEPTQLALHAEPPEAQPYAGRFPGWQVFPEQHPVGQVVGLHVYKVVADTTGERMLPPVAFHASTA